MPGRSTIVLAGVLLAAALLLWWSPFAWGETPSIEPAAKNPVDQRQVTTKPAGTQSAETGLRRLEVDTATADAKKPPRNRRRIWGRVIDGKDRSPVKGALVQLRHREADAFEILNRDYTEGTREIGRCTTAADGRFALSVQHPDVYRLKVSAAGYAPVERPDILGGSEILVQLAAPASLHVTVTADGKPVASAKLRLASERVILATGHTEVDGTCHLAELPEGKAWLQTFAPGYRGGWNNVELEAGEEQRIHVRLRTGREIRGRVLSKASGEPVVGAEVSDSFEFERTVRSGADGRFRFPAASKRDIWMFVWAKGFANSTPGLTATSTEEVVILLESGGAVTGRLVDENGKAPGHAFCAATAVFVESNGRRMTEYPEWIRGHVGPSGHFRVSGLRPARHYWLYVCARGYGTRMYALPRGLDNDHAHDMGTLVLRPEGGVSGRILDPEGKPRVGVRVTLKGGNSDSRSHLEIKRPSDNRLIEQRRSKSDSNGEFFFANVSAGSYQVIARSQSSGRTTKQTVRVEDGKVHEGVELVLGKGRTIAGQMLLPDGRAFKGLKLWLHALNEDGSFAQAITDAEGRFRFKGLNEGLHSIRVVRNQGDRSWILRPVHKVPGGTIDLQLKLERGMSISGRVVDASGKPCRAWVRALPSNAVGKMRASLTQITDEDGEFEIHVLADFVGSLVASSPQLNHARASLDGIHAGQRELEIRYRR